MKRFSKRILGRNQKRKAQTALEYLMLLAVIVLPLAAAINAAYDSGASDDDGEGQQHIVKRVTESAFGSNNQMGVIGRPYP